MGTHAEARQGTRRAIDDTSRLDGMDESHRALRTILGHADGEAATRAEVTAVEYVGSYFSIGFYDHGKTMPKAICLGCLKSYCCVYHEIRDLAPVTVCDEFESVTK